MPEKSSEVPHFGADVADVNEPATCKEAADSTELKVPNSENDLKSSDGDGKLLSEIGDKSGQSEYAVKKISKLIEQDGDSTINQMMKEEASEKLEPDVKEDGTSLHEDKKVQDGEPQKNLLSQPADILEGGMLRSRTQQRHKILAHCLMLVVLCSLNQWLTRALGDRLWVQSLRGPTCMLLSLKMFFQLNDS